MPKRTKGQQLDGRHVKTAKTESETRTSQAQLEIDVNGTLLVLLANTAACGQLLLETAQTLLLEASKEYGVAFTYENMYKDGREAEAGWMAGSSSQIRVLCNSEEFLQKMLYNSRRLARVEETLVEHKREIAENKRVMRALALTKVRIVANEVLMHAVYGKQSSPTAKDMTEQYCRLARGRRRLMQSAAAREAGITAETFVERAVKLRYDRNEDAHAVPDLQEHIKEAMDDYVDILRGVEKAKFAVFVVEHSAELMA